MGDPIAKLAGLACHDIRTPLATIGGFAKTLLRAGELSERDARFVVMIDEAAGQITDLVGRLALASRIAGGSYEPSLDEGDTLDLAGGGPVGASGTGTVVETDLEVVRSSLAALSTAALRWGAAPELAWTVAGRELALHPIPLDALPVLDGSNPRDVGALVARMALERLGGMLTVEGDALLVTI